MGFQNILGRFGNTLGKQPLVDVVWHFVAIIPVCSLRISHTLFISLIPPRALKSQNFRVLDYFFTLSYFLEWPWWRSWKDQTPSYYHRAQVDLARRRGLEVGLFIQDLPHSEQNFLMAPSCSIPILIAAPDYSWPWNFKICTYV